MDDLFLLIIYIAPLAIVFAVAGAIAEYLDRRN